ncbi:hypothetical protein SAMN02745883_00666 [Caminicella sporogenes DSM 14501]|uniref:N-acetyltransferase domain-containing protein n=1 Tax=Caminicella sporogenes DSM 14501 TaxID=1121266 RepID=A0A1M6MVZ6_9FIRM|nr:GNAT family N-acetyltransferase [Caminicella sporogenes]RKD22478.1 hypothetical protein BET04_05445 [Caminicella sporogenes]SHJ87586.1 hypothetical protein SAMN02745883_00666 [Caminicella sporogenes DSM 14501]
MEEFRLLKKSDFERVLNYLNRHHFDVSFMIGNIENYGVENNKVHKKHADYYGYFIDDELKGVFSFTNMGSLICHYEEKNILNKMILLKLIKQYRPKVIMGIERLVDPLWTRLEKIAKWFKYDRCDYMILNKDIFMPADTEKKIIKASEYDFSKSIDFLIEVEKAFNRNPKTINELKSTIYDRLDEEEYLYLLDGDNIVSQGIIQTTTSKINQIGGVYTLPQYREKGYAKAIVSKLCKEAIKRNKIPTLIVSKTNERAKKVYRGLGFEFYNHYSYIEVQF